MAIVRKKKNFAPTLKLKRNIQMKKKCLHQELLINIKKLIKIK